MARSHSRTGRPASTAPSANSWWRSMTPRRTARGNDSRCALAIPAAGSTTTHRRTARATGAACRRAETERRQRATGTRLRRPREAGKAPARTETHARHAHYPVCMTVRRLTEDDAELYRDLRLEGLRNVPTAFGSSYEESERRPLSAYAERLRPTEDTAVFGAFEQGSLVGSVGLFRESGLKERHKAMLWGMYVTPAARRTGVA